MQLNWEHYFIKYCCVRYCIVPTSY